MAVNLSNFLSTSFVLDVLDSSEVAAIVVSTPGIPLDSNTTGNYVKAITASDGVVVAGSGAHGATVVLSVDSSRVVIPNATQTLTNKTINLTNNTLSMTIGQLNAALTGDNVATLTGTETLTNKTLTSPTINTPSVSGGSFTDLTTFGLRDVTTTAYETRIVSNNASPALSADRTLTLDVNNANRTISLTGDITVAGSFTTSGAFGLTLTQTGTTSVTLPTSGTLANQSYVTSTIDSNYVRLRQSYDYASLTNRAGQIVNSDINASAAIADTKLATISTAGKVSNSATTATSANTASAIVARDGSGNFSAGTITAALSGNATTATTASIGTTATVTASGTSSAFKVPIVNTTGNTTGNYGLLMDNASTFTYNPSSNTLAVSNVTLAGALTGGNLTSSNFASAVQFIVYDSDGSVLKSLYGTST